MIKILKTPFFGANDTEAVFLSWVAEDGKKVNQGALLGSIETTKAVIDVSAENTGYLYHLTEPGQRVGVGQPLALVSDEPLENPAEVASQIEQESKTSKNKSITKKAELLVRRHKLDFANVLEFAHGSLINEDLVSRFLKETMSNGHRYGQVSRQRVGIVGGVSGGGALIVIDSILRNPSQEAVCIFDQDCQLAGRHILGVPVVGSIELLQEWLDVGRLDAVVIAFNRDLEERWRVFDRLESQGVPFCNVIDPSAEIRTKVEMGNGNVVLGRVYVGACSRIGDNNFISANVCLEHGNVVGSHNGFGPGVFTSGNVTIGSGIRFATGIFIEPAISIGDHSVIASGSIVTSDVKPGTTVKEFRRSCA